MGYMIAGAELETDAEGYLLEPDYNDETVNVIAAAEGIDTDARALADSQLFAGSISRAGSHAEFSQHAERGSGFHAGGGQQNAV